MKKISNLIKYNLLLLGIILIILIFKLLNLFPLYEIIVSILKPLIIGYIYAWLLNPLIKKLSNDKNRSFICIIVFILLISIISIFFYFLIPSLYKETNEFIYNLPNYTNKIYFIINKLGIKVHINKMINSIINKIPLLLIKIVKECIKNIGVIAIGIFMGLYISIDYEKLLCIIDSFITKKNNSKITNLFFDISNNVRKCVNGTVLVAFIVFILDSICFLILKLDMPILLGTLCGFTDLIPYIGPYIGGIAAVIIGFGKGKSIGLLTIICVCVVQIIENNILQPTIMSKSIKISPIFIMIGLLFFGKLFGIMGMILATPIVSIIKVVINYYIPKTKSC